MKKPVMNIKVDLSDFEEIRQTESYQTDAKLISGHIEIGSVIEFENFSNQERFQKSVTGMFPSLDHDDEVVFLYFGISTLFESPQLYESSAVC